MGTERDQQEAEPASALGGRWPQVSSRLFACALIGAALFGLWNSPPVDSVPVRITVARPMVSAAVASDWSSVAAMGVQSDPVVVDPKAVLVAGAGASVFVVRDDAVERREVRLGALTRDGQVVLEGLPAGTQLALGDFRRLSNGITVQVIR